MKFLYAVLFLVLAGLCFSRGALGGCGFSPSETSGGTDSAFVITDGAVTVDALAPIVNYSVPDKLRSKRRARVDSTLCTSLVLCALSVVLSGLFYSKFCAAVSRMRGFDSVRRRALPYPVLFAAPPIGAALLI